MMILMSPSIASSFEVTCVFVVMRGFIR